MPNPTLPTRKQQLFNAKMPPPAGNVIPATVSFIHNKKRGLIEPLSVTEKMLCALRKVLTVMSDKDPNGNRFYIANNKVQLLEAPVVAPGKAGDARSYRARGRCKLAVTHAEHITHKMIEFDISYRDIIDDRGLADVVYMEPTSIDELPRSTPIDTSSFS